MKKLTCVIFGLLALSGCNHPNKQSSGSTIEQPTAKQTPIGGTKDEHGCLVSAGQTWSEIRQNCIQVFHEGIRLNPVVAEDGKAVTSAFLLYSTDSSKAELFMPEGQKNSIILDNTRDKIYMHDGYRFDGKENMLYINGEKKYGSEN